MDDVARVAGVSKGAVYHVLNNRPGEIGPETRQRILAAMRDVGYRPPPSRRSAVRGRYDTLGIVMGCTSREIMRPSYYNAVVESVFENIEARSLNLTFYTGRIFEVDTLDKIRLYCDGRCDGLLLLGTRKDSPLFEGLEERAVPFVVIGDPTERFRTACIDVDNSHGIYALVDYLMWLGHRRIGFVIGPSYVTAANIRREAFSQHTVRQGAIGYCPDVIDGDDTSALIAWIHSMMALPTINRPTAFIAWNDHYAGLTMNALKLIGLSVPTDISVAGFNDDAPEKDRPRLTTYRQPYKEIGRRAVELCLERFEGASSGSHVELLPGKLVLRESTAPPQS